METVLNLFQLNGKIALVTGGAEGIGRAIALALGQAGAKICISGRSEEKLQNAESLFKKQGIDLYTIAFDVSKEDQVQLAIKKINEDVGTIDILVNNAGIIKRVPILEMETDDFKEVIDVDLVSPFILSKYIVPDMIRKGGGKVINMCSLMSTYGRNSVSAYAAAKGGLKMLTRNMCVEWGKHNIQVNGIAPGYIKTAKTAAFTHKDHPFNKLIMTRTPAGRWGEVGDLGGLALLLSSRASDFISGQIMYVDGGITANLGYLEGETK